MRTGMSATILSVAVAAAAIARPAPPDSGLRGIVLYGPTCPVQRPGHICERPVQATIVVSRTGSRLTVARTRSAPDGRFSIRVGAGRYLVKTSSGATGYRRAQSQVVSVTAHRFTELTIRIDSGIR
jgi:hypothetical protein